MESENPHTSASAADPLSGRLDDEELPQLDYLVEEPCQEAIATLYSFLDGELTPERREQISHHLDDCAPCFEAFGFEAELKAVIARNCRDEVPESLRKRVAEVLRKEALGAKDARA
jgi:mycothiol system anti-sigma-R factor